MAVTAPRIRIPGLLEFIAAAVGPAAFAFGGHTASQLSANREGERRVGASHPSTGWFLRRNSRPLRCRHLEPG